jgi:hypothetical protein
MEIEKKDHVGAISLPFDQDQFKDFIVGLLGKPQTISKFFQGSFEIDKHRLTALYEIVCQRILQQNDAKIIQFRTTIYYEDNSSTTLNGFDHLVHYNEKLPLISIAAHLTWQFLVKFQDKDIYEKQEINLSIVTNTDRHVKLDIEDLPYRMHGSYVLLKIQHTARSFGADIESLFSKQLDRLISKPSKLREFLYFGFDERHRVVFLVLMLISFFGAIISTKGKNFTDISIFSTHFFNLLFLILGTALFSVLISYIMSNFYFYSKPSFLLLTPESEKDMKKKNLKFKRDSFSYVFTLIFGIITGLISNYLFYKLIN